MRPIRSRFLIPLLLLLIFPLLAQTQSPRISPAAKPASTNPLWIDLSGPWKLTFEDRPEFSAPSFDDHSWQSTSLPGEIPSIRSGLQFRGWLRRRVDLPPTYDCSHLALTLGVITQSRYEVWINDNRLPSSEVIGRSDVRIPRPITHLIPPLPSPCPASVLIAIHFISFDMHPDWRIADKGPYLLTDQINAPVDVGGQSLAGQRDVISAPLVFAIATFLVLAILCLVAFSTDRARPELFWFALIAVARIVYSVVQLAGLYPSASSLPARLNFITEFFVLPIHGEVILSALGIRRKPWLHALNWVLFTPVVLFTFGSTSFDVAAMACVASGTLLTAIILIDWWQNRHAGLSVEDRLLRLILLLPCIQIGIYWAAYLNGVVLYAFGAGATLGIPIFRFDSSWFVVALAIFVILMRRTLADRRTQQRLAQELEAARQVQNLLVAGGRSSAPDLAIDTAYLPAQEVGGDFYYVLDGRVVVLGDVSGKGLKAAMLVSLLIGVLRDTAERQPAAVLAALNRALVGQVDGGFVTCICARFEPSGSATFANAGHLLPYLNGSELTLDSRFPLGVLPEAEFTETTVPLAPDSFVTLFSDGVVEAMNSRRELFGFDRTREISTATAGKIVETARAWGQNDDITVVTIRNRT